MSYLSNYQLDYIAPSTIKLYYGKPVMQPSEHITRFVLVKSADYLDYIAKRATRASKEFRRVNKWL